MKCPKCGEQTVDGYIPASKMALLFIPNKNGTLPLTIFGKGENTVPLTKVPFWKMQKAEAFYCPQCKLVIAPVKDMD